MNELKTFFRYQLFTRNPQRQRKMNFGPLNMVMSFGIFFVMILMFFTPVLKQVSQIVVEGINMADVLVGTILTFAGISLVLGIFSSSVYMFIKNEELEMLLTMPVKRWTMVIYQLIICQVYQSTPAAMFLGISITYFIAMGKNIFLGILASLLLTMVLLLIGTIAAVYFGRFLSKTLARKMVFVFQIMSLGIFIVITQLRPTGITEPTALMNWMTNAWIFISSTVNIFAWPIQAIKNPVLFAIMLISIPVLILTLVNIANRMSFEPITHHTRKRSYKIAKGTSATFAIIKRELQVFVRHEQLLYYLLYPAAFSLIMSIISKDITGAIYFYTMMSSMFISVQAAFLLAIESPFWETTKTMPISLKKLLKIKLFLPIVLNTLIMVIEVLALGLILGKGLLLLLAIIPNIPVFSTAALIGMSSILSKPPQKLDNPNSYFRSADMKWKPLLASVLGLAVVLPLSMLLIGSWKSGTIALLIGIGLPAAATIVSIIISRNLYLRIMTKIETW